ncbi:MAG: hypothetical protein D6738_01260 [Acidobacteria bacterium]|nr:MAG: hypothetical protein D6738_01260 [Acidobacteriota bacterium]
MFALSATHRGALVALLVSGALCAAGACRSPEREAQRALEQALADDRRPAPELRAELERIVETWPETEAARRARREIQSVDEIDRALARGLGLRAWDAVRAVARAVEQYRARHGRLPERIEDLVPRHLARLPEDPWGRPVVYTRRGRGYVVVSYGQDGLPGGSGAARDYVVDSGRVVGP